MVRVEDLVVVRQGERVGVAGAEGEVAFELALESDEGPASEKFDLAVLAQTGDKVREAGALPAESGVSTGCTSRREEETDVSL